jgi:hypothetical protein
MNEKYINKPTITPNILAIRSLMLNDLYGRKYWIASAKMANKQPIRSQNQYFFFIGVRKVQGANKSK